MILNEIFKDTKVNVQWQGNNATFEFGNYQYIIQFIHMRPNDMIHGPISNQPITQNTWFFAFAAQPVSGGGMTDQETGAGQSIAVFSVILQELEKFVQQKNVDTLYFGCSLNKENRKRLYDRLVRRYTATSGWNLISEVQARFFGDLKHIWIVQKL